MLTATCPRCKETYTATPPFPIQEKFVRPFRLLHVHFPWPDDTQRPIWTMEDARGVILMCGAGHWGEVFQPGTVPANMEGETMDDPKGKYYYYAGERGCMKDPEAVDAIGVGINDGPNSFCLTINLLRLRDHGHEPHYTMRVEAHNDAWRAFVDCRDVLDLLAKKGIRSGEMTDTEPFYVLRLHLEKLGYRNLGVLSR